MVKKSPHPIASLSEEAELLREEIKQLKLKLAMSNSAFLNIVGKSLDGVIIIDQMKMVVYTNYAAIQLFNRNIADLLGEPLDLDFNPESIVDSGETTTEICIPKAGGQEAITEVSVLKTEWNSEPCYLVSFRDITERKKSEEILSFMSTHDYLTSLPNRVYFEKQIDKAIQHARDNELSMALVYLDLDNFKMINDTLGHGAGDLLLKDVSTLLLQNVRRGDTVARLGGDEFALILNGIRNKDYAAKISRSILDKLSKAFYLGGKDVYINASIGIATYPSAGTNAEELIKNADMAMYAAKMHGKNQYRFFSEELNQQNEETLKIINGLRNSIRNKELSLQYQPIIDLNKLTCWGVEVLLRWKHPQLGLLLPHQFLPFAEDMGFMTVIGQWVIRQALDHYSTFNLDPPLYLSINLSANELLSVEAVDTILSCMQKLTLPSSKHLIVELTETSVMSSIETTMKQFMRLSEAGVQIAIDDYGVGYSSLNVIKRLPVSILKIDKSFTDGIGKDPQDTIIVQSTIQLAHSLGLKVVAEGVETKTQLAFLKKQGCDYIQGYYFSKPLDPNQLTAYVRQLGAVQ